MMAQLTLFEDEIPEAICCDALIGDTLVLTVNGTRYRATAGLRDEQGRVKLHHIRKEVTHD